MSDDSILEKWTHYAADTIDDLRRQLADHDEAMESMQQAEIESRQTMPMTTRHTTDTDYKDIEAGLTSTLAVTQSATVSIGRDILIQIRDALANLRRQRDEAERRLSNLKHNDEHGFTTAAIRRTEAAEAQLAEVQREHTDMMWQRRRADECADRYKAERNAAESKRDRYKAERDKAQMLNDLRAVDIMALSRDHDRWKALAEGERERAAKLADEWWMPTAGFCEHLAYAIRDLPAPSLPEDDKEPSDA